MGNSYIINHSQPLMESGLDSLSAIDLRNAIERHFAVQLPATVIFDYPSIDALTGIIASLAASKPASTLPIYGNPTHYLLRRFTLSTLNH